ncbi:GGDEF domain-containing protein [Actinoplanes sp. NPDC051346]|uniref:tetratricopeptide repeat-containing diguanylate cyclase n=1 Tax=Actinoplanes sp. NPDC051346 TaxID=3155048 RepID=UPI003422156B
MVPLAPPQERAGGGAPAQADPTNGLGRFAGPPPYTDAALAEAMEAMEVAAVLDFRSVAVPATRAERFAAERGRVDLQMRARLLGAAVRCRRGDVATAGRIGMEVNTWATERQEAYVLARSHCLLSIVFRNIGDPAEALTHAVQAVAHTADDVTPWLRASPLVVLGVALTINSSVEEGTRRFTEALDIAVAAGDAAMILMVLNNMTYAACSTGDPQRALELANRMRTIAATHGMPLYGHYRDTIARVEMTLGRYAEAEQLLRPVLDDPDGPLLNEGDALADCLQATAEAQRLQGATERAQVTLDRSFQVSRERGLKQAAVWAHQEQAELYAATGRYKEAFEEFRRFHDALLALQSVEREVRARTMQAIFETEEARRASDRFRELALRDPLTGLHNRRHVDQQLPALIAHTAEQQTPLSVALLDLDYFKRINDTLSHDAGDHVLKQVADLLTGAVAAPAVVARMGGEEFVVLLPDADAATAATTCERIRRTVGDHPWHPITGDLPVTVSIGVTTVHSGAATASALLADADRNLYAAKRSGRDRVFSDPC